MRRWLFIVANRLYALVRPHTRGVKGLVVDGAGRVLLVRHTYTYGWHIPGGGIKRHESEADALVRELREEVGVDVLVAPELLGAYRGRNHGRRDDITVYIVRGWRQTVHGNLEIAEARFFALDAIPDTASRATRRRLAEYTGRRPVTETW